MPILAAALFTLATVATAVGVAALLGRLPRNSWVGVRTAATVDDDAAFRIANRIAAPALLAAGLILILGGVGALAIGGLFGVAAALTALVAAIFTAGAGANVAANAAVPTVPATPCGSACGGCSLRDTCAS